MFAPASGFSKMLHRLVAETVYGIVDRAFEVISDVAPRYQGTTNQYLGDGVIRCSGPDRGRTISA